jgi:hypothetical protein
MIGLRRLIAAICNVYVLNQAPIAWPVFFLAPQTFDAYILKNQAIS